MASHQAAIQLPNELWRVFHETVVLLNPGRSAWPHLRLEKTQGADGDGLPAQPCAGARVAGDAVEGMY